MLLHFQNFPPSIVIYPNTRNGGSRVWVIFGDIIDQKTNLWVLCSYLKVNMARHFLKSNEWTTVEACEIIQTVFLTIPLGFCHKS